LEAIVAQLLVRNLEDDVKARLQRRARRHGHSTEEEVREILRNAVREEGPPPSPLGSRLRARFAGLGVDHDVAELRGETARPESSSTPTSSPP
jgi:plasmid stability protein